MGRSDLEGPSTQIPNVAATYMFRRDPYESEEDKPQVFSYEGRCSPAWSLSSLDSDVSHLDDLELPYFKIQNSLRNFSPPG